MKRLLACFALLALSTALHGQVHSGMTLDEVLAVKGAPESKAAGPKKSIYRWSDLEVTIVNGQVAQWKRRDPATERANAEERKKKAEALATPGPQTPKLSPEDKAQRLLNLREELEVWKTTRDTYFDDFSKPDNVRRIAASKRDLAEAKIARIEKEIDTLQRQ